MSTEMVQSASFVTSTTVQNQPRANISGTGEEDAPKKPMTIDLTADTTNAEMDKPNNRKPALPLKPTMVKTEPVQASFIQGAMNPRMLRLAEAEESVKRSADEVAESAQTPGENVRDPVAKIRHQTVETKNTRASAAKGSAPEHEGSVTDAFGQGGNVNQDQANAQAPKHVIPGALASFTAEIKEVLGVEQFRPIMARALHKFATDHRRMRELQEQISQSKGSAGTTLVARNALTNLCNKYTTGDVLKEYIPKPEGYTQIFRMMVGDFEEFGNPFSPGYETYETHKQDVEYFLEIVQTAQGGTEVRLSQAE